MRKVLFAIIGMLILSAIAGCSVPPVPRQNTSYPNAVPDNGKAEPAQDDGPASDIEPDQVNTTALNKSLIPLKGNQTPQAPIDTGRHSINLSFTVENGNVKLKWTRYPGDIKNYKVSRANTDATPTYPTNELLSSLTPSDLSYTDTDPYGGVNYYSVTAIGMLNEKYDSNPVEVDLPDPKETAPDQVMEITAEKTAEGIQLTWTKYNGDLLYYKVVRSSENPKPKYPYDDVLVTEATANVTTHLDRTAEPGLNYYAISIVRKDKSKFTSAPISIMN